MATTVEQILNSRDLYGKKIYLLGTAVLGPVNTPIKMNSLAHAISIFGGQGSLIDAYKIIIETRLSCEVYLCKVTGTHSEVYLNVNQSFNEVIENGMYIKSKHANENYNDVTITLSDESLFIEYNPDDYNGYILEYSYSNNPSLHGLVESINEDTRNLKSEIYCYTNCEANTQTIGSLDTVNPTTLKLSGGNSGLYYNKNMYYNCLDETYAMLEGLDIDIIIPLDANYDDTFTDNEEHLENYYNLNREYLTLKNDNKEYCSYYTQLLKFCKNQMRFGSLTNGIMGTYIIDDPHFDEEEYLKKLVFFNECNEQIKENQKYKHLISVVVGDLYNMYGAGISNGYIAYSAIVASLIISENTTNRMLPKTFITSTVFSQKAIDKLQEIGFTSFRYSVLKKVVVVTNGITTSSDEAFKYFVNVRMSQLTMCYVRKLLSSFIGEDLNNILVSKSLEQGLKSLLNSLVRLNVITGYGVNELINPVTGHIFLDLSLKTIYMIENVRAYSGLASKG